MQLADDQVTEIFNLEDEFDFYANGMSLRAIVIGDDGEPVYTRRVAN